MSRRQRPEPGVEYAAAPTPEYAAARVSEAARSLGTFLGCTELRAAALLSDRGALTAELRARQADPLILRRQLERKYADPTVMR